VVAVAVAAIGVAVAAGATLQAVVAMAVAAIEAEARTLQVVVVMVVEGGTAMGAAMPAVTAMVGAIWVPQRSERLRVLPLTAATALTAPTTIPLSAGIIPIQRARTIDRARIVSAALNGLRIKSPRHFAGGRFRIQTRTRRQGIVARLELHFG
jgi:hypothetical protein